MAGGDQHRGPDFIGVGTQRSGTTWWFESLLEHPAIVLPRSGKKELHYFERFGLRPMNDHDVRHYRERFAPEPGQISGEWTPRYMRDFWTPPLLRRAAPDAKLLVMLRDPVERFRSGVPHRLGMSTDLREETVVVDAIERGRYAMQLQRLLAHCEPERVHVIQYEKCVADPAEQYGRTLRFLGVDDSFLPEDMRKRRGVSYEDTKEPLWADLEAGMKAALEDDALRLPALTRGEIDLSLWPNFRHLAGQEAGLAGR